MSGRKILHPLQPVANNQQMLVGGNGFIRLSKKDNVENKINDNSNELKDRLSTTTTIVKKQKSRSVKYVNQENMKLAVSTKQPSDEAKPANDRDQEIIKKEESSDSEIISWMTSDVAPEGYWKKIAEERKLALAVTLEKNKDLHEENERLKKENFKLQKSLDEVLEEVNELITSQQDDSGFLHD